MRVYKVVFKARDGRLTSAIALVEYQPGQWAEAPKWLAEKGYHLFAFKTLEDARVAIGDSLCKDFFEIWEAEAEGIVEDLPEPADRIVLAEGKIVKDDIGYPDGTVMAKRLKVWP